MASSFTGAPNTASFSSISATLLFSMSYTPATNMSSTLRTRLLTLLDRLPDEDKPVLAAGHGALDKDHIYVRSDSPYQQVLGCLPFAPHMAGELRSLENPRRIRAGADGTRRPVEHGTVRRPAAVEPVTFYNTGKSLAFCRPDHIHIVPGFKNLGAQFLPRLAIFDIHPDFPENAEHPLVRLPEVSLKGLGHIFLLAATVTELQCVVTVLHPGLLLDDHGRLHLYDRHGNGYSFVRKHLGHPQFFADQSFCHHLSLLAGITTCPEGWPNGPRNLPGARCVLHLDLYIHARRQIELHQGVHRRLRRLDDINQSFMRSDLELLP